MDSHQLLAWALVAVIGAATPGIDLMIVLRSTILQGRRAGFAAVIGVELGHAVWAVASLLGLTALLAASTLAYDVVRIAGACYLVWLGCTAIWKSLPRNRSTAAEPEALPAQSAGSAVRNGMTSNLLNPKVGVFYISILPQFLPTVPSAAGWGVLLVAIALTIGTVWHAAVVLLATRARGILTRERVKIWLDRTSAAVMIALGVRLATEARA
ncbi:MAG: LysE family translocator [Brevibacterium aurantiacum]|uniref:LysE family translocator n=1 Tax=Brevibacterium aurantiacum TaxID=273384 RepID=A0A2A3ZFV5_BREAU|nr:LysE family translocator [Brevibacterium aurantiacum]MDN5550894.1 LysE family translocator [Brevibacterium sp.]AZL10165.1 LysE family translocator [Brevibacterium aurantiacum]AZL13873.1 LysE family translocator [Brevibacterium aurantiacum]AZT94380.1 LysE family translocator [Brevibacterium aurantiacum]AZT98152.1 LysE family translocator [Brevibacterium aurantiacum]